jgi:hypothetical protein
MNNFKISKKHKIIAAICIITISVLTFLYVTHLIRQTEEQKKLREQLQADISNQVILYESGEAPNIDLSKLTSFSWDRLYIFGSYLPLDLIQERLGSSWEPSEPLALGYGASFTLFIFTLDEEVVRYVAYPMELGNFSEAGKKMGGYKPSEAIFVINDYGYILWQDQ